MKANAAEVNGEWVDVYKDPITDPGKTSKKGRQALVFRDGFFQTIPHANLVTGGHGIEKNYLRKVFSGGNFLSKMTSKASASGHADPADRRGPETAPFSLRKKHVGSGFTGVQKPYHNIAIYHGKDTALLQGLPSTLLRHLFMRFTGSAEGKLRPLRET